MLFIITITSFFVLMERTNGGYIYPRPNILFKLPKIEPNFQKEIQQNMINTFLPQPLTEHVISYSVPFQNNQEPYQGNSNLIRGNIYASKVSDDLTTIPLLSNQNNFGTIPVSHHDIPAASIPYLTLFSQIQDQQNNLAANTGQQINIPVANIPIDQNNDLVGSTYLHANLPTVPAVNVLQTIKGQNHLVVNTVQHRDIIANGINNDNLFAPAKPYDNVELIPHLNTLTMSSPAPVHLKSNTEFTSQQDNIRDLNSPKTLQEDVTPKIMKHVYFHVPPPEIEEPSVRAVTPKIKNVKIIFIKVPSQEKKQSQRNAISQVVPIEEKVIIYVLSKKSSTQQVYLSRPESTKHEVFFVKYDGSVDNAVKQISDNLDQIES